MAKNIIRTGGSLIVPAFTRFIEYDEILIIDEKLIELSRLDIERNGFDVFCSFGEYSLGIVFTSPERKMPEFNTLKHETGVLVISLSNARKEFFSPSRVRHYKSILEETIFWGTKNKQWLYHPRIEKYKKTYGDRLLEKPPLDIESIVGGIRQTKPGIYQCKKCKIRWRGYLQCPACHNCADIV